ncbi:MAG: hypothetical protein ACKO14_01205 [Armatimonadota bacterium]
MKFRFSLIFVLFGILTYGCGLAIFRLITTGQMPVGRGASRMLTSQSDLPVMLPIMVVLFIIFAFATFWSATNDIE